jgi:hypothetical protein
MLVLSKIDAITGKSFTSQIMTKDTYPSENGRSPPIFTIAAPQWFKPAKNVANDHAKLNIGFEVLNQIQT